MSIAFQTIPSQIRVPFFHVEMDNSQASSFVDQRRRLIMAQVNTEQTEGLNQLQIVSTHSQARQMGGAGSMLSLMVNQFRLNDNFGELWVLPLQINDGKAASATLTISGTAKQAGSAYLYVAGTRVPLIIVDKMTAADLAQACINAINKQDLPVTAALADAQKKQTAAESVVINLTSRFKGLASNDISIQLNPLGRAAGQMVPNGLNITVTTMSGGTGTVDIQTALAAIGDEAFEYIAQPWSDDETLSAFKEWMSDKASGRWSWQKKLYGHVYTAAKGTLGELIALGEKPNDAHLTIVGIEKSLPQPSWLVAAALLGVYGAKNSADVAAPVQNCPLLGLSLPQPSERFNLSERDSLLNHGIATVNHDSGQVCIERAITTYLVNDQGQPDNSYLDSETLHTSATIIRFIRQRLVNKFAGKKLGKGNAMGRNVVTPNVIRAELLASYHELERLGVVENAKDFAKYLQVEVDPQDPCRVNILFPPDYVNQLRVFAVVNQFRLNYPN